jgi:hypothetical protein
MSNIGKDPQSGVGGCGNVCKHCSSPLGRFNKLDYISSSFQYLTLVRKSIVCPLMRSWFFHIAGMVILVLGLCSCGKRDTASKKDQTEDLAHSVPVGQVASGVQAPKASETPPPPGSHVQEVKKVRNDEEFKRTVHELLDLLHQGSQKSRSELLEATAQGDSKKFAALVKQGLDVNVSNQDGRTILMDAVEVEYLNFVRALIKAGADVNAMDKNGKTALQIATAKKNAEMIQLLKEAGANQ